MMIDTLIKYLALSNENVTSQELLNYTGVFFENSMVCVRGYFVKV